MALEHEPHAKGQKKRIENQGTDLRRIGHKGGNISYKPIMVNRRGNRHKLGNLTCKLKISSCERDPKSMIDLEPH